MFTSMAGFHRSSSTWRKTQSESVNVAEDPDYAGVRLEMMQKMIDHRMSHAHQSHTRMTITSDGVNREPR